MTIARAIYKQLPNRIQPLIRNIHHKYTHTHTNFSPLEKYRREIENSEEYKDKIQTYTRTFDSNEDSTNCGGLQREAVYDIYSIVRELEPSTVVETGVANGISSLAVLLALEQNKKGRLISIDKPVYLEYTRKEIEKMNYDRPGWKIPADKESGWLISNKLRNRWDLIKGKSIDNLPDVVEANSVDMFIHDSDHSTTNMVFEFFVCYENMNRGGIIVSDDISESQAFEIFTRENELSDYGELSSELGYMEI